MTRRHLTEADAILRLKAAITMVGSEHAFAAAHGFTLNYLKKVLRGARGLGPEILTAIGLEPVVMYRLVRRPSTTPTTTTPRSGGRKV